MSEIASDVAIIGGGLMGASAAFFLARRRRSVTLIESGLVGQQASGVNFGNVRRQGRPMDQLPLANRSSVIWRRLKEWLEFDVEYLEAGHLRVSYRDRPDLAAKLEDYAREARQRDLELEILSGNALRARFPFLGPEVAVGSFSVRDGHANPRLVAPAFGRAAARLGVCILENTEALHVEKSGEDFRIVCAGGQAVRAPALLITAGAWAAPLAAQFGESVSTIARGPTMSVTEPVPYAIAPAVGVYTTEERESVYFRQVTRGNIVIGGSFRGTAYPDIRRAYVTPENSLSQFAQIRRLAPALARLNVIRVWSGIEGYTPDDQPVLGPSAKVNGLYYAFGFSGSGFQLGPGVGDTMAELIDAGATATPLDGYRIDRFG